MSKVLICKVESFKGEGNEQLSLLVLRLTLAQLWSKISNMGKSCTMYISICLINFDYQAVGFFQFMTMP